MKAIDELYDFVEWKRLMEFIGWSKSWRVFNL